MDSAQTVEKSVSITASPEEVWIALTHPERMAEWMAEPEMELKITTDWTMGSPILITGIHHGKFENHGTVLLNIPQQMLVYNYLSSTSRLPNLVENHTIIEFRLMSERDCTLLHFKAMNFPTESIYRHVEFYWKGTLEILKTMIETRVSSEI